MQRSVGIIGIGVIGSTFVSALSQKAWDLSLFDKCSDQVQCACARYQRAKHQGTCQGTQTIEELMTKHRLILLAVQVYKADAALAEMRPFLKPEKHVIISCLAGWTIARLQEQLSKDTPVIRCMPSVSSRVGAGAFVYDASRCCPEDQALMAEIADSMGHGEALEERYFDAATAVVGSGPAMVALFTEALADGGVLSGLPREAADRLAAHTVRGLGTLCTTKAEGVSTHPALIKDTVCSPGGTTIAGVFELEKAGVRGAVMSAVKAATDRSREMRTE